MIKAQKREKIRDNRRKMIVSNRGIFTLVSIIRNRAAKRRGTVVK